MKTVLKFIAHNEDRSSEFRIPAEQVERIHCGDGAMDLVVELTDGRKLRTHHHGRHTIQVVQDPG